MQFFVWGWCGIYKLYNGVWLFWVLVLINFVIKYCYEILYFHLHILSFELEIFALRLPKILRGLANLKIWLSCLFGFRGQVSFRQPFVTKGFLDEDSVKANTHYSNAIRE